MPRARRAADRRRRATSRPESRSPMRATSSSSAQWSGLAPRTRRSGSSRSSAQALDLPRESMALQLFLGAARSAPAARRAACSRARRRSSGFSSRSLRSPRSRSGRNGPGGPTCLIDAGATAQTRRFRARRVSAPSTGSFAETGARGTILGAPVMRWETPWAALVARTRVRQPVTSPVPFLTEAAAAMSPVIEREVVLERSASRERSLVRASERRLGRLAFDLHDGALQHIAALGSRPLPLQAPIDRGAVRDRTARAQCLADRRPRRPNLGARPGAP